MFIVISQSRIFDEMDQNLGACLPALLKLYIYALHGYFVEVTFTAVWDLIATGNWRLQGCSSIWSLGIYGTCGLALEELSKFLRAKNVPVYFRAIIYVLLIYFWEYTSGTILSWMSACPWDYMEFSYNVGGLITLEYAPFWLITGLLTEKIVIDRLGKLRWTGHQDKTCSESNGFVSTNGIINSKKN